MTLIVASPLNDGLNNSVTTCSIVASKINIAAHLNSSPRVFTKKTLSPQLYSSESGGGSNPHQLDEAIKVMASHVVELHDNGGEVMHVPPGEDISERLVPVTADNQPGDTGINEAGDGKPGGLEYSGIKF